MPVRQHNSSSTFFTHGTVRGVRIAHILACLLNLGAAACSANTGIQLPYDLSASETRIVREVLAKNPMWRIALSTDAKDRKAVQQLRETMPRFEPFFSRAAIGTRGSAFAFVLLNGTEFKVFYSRSEGSVSFPTQEVATVHWLNDGRVFLRQDTLDIAPFQSDEIFVFAWNPGRGRLELIPSRPDTANK